MFSIQCGEEGHMSRECPQGGGAGGGGDRACFKVIACHKFSKFQSTNLTLSF